MEYKELLVAKLMANLMECRKCAATMLGAGKQEGLKAQGAILLTRHMKMADWKKLLKTEVIILKIGKRSSGVKKARAAWNYSEVMIKRNRSPKKITRGGHHRKFSVHLTRHRRA